MGSTTPKFAIPYPTGTDRVMDGDNAMQSIAERVEAILGPAWIPLPYAAGWSDPGGFQTGRYRKVADEVQVEAYPIRGGSVAPVDTIVATLPTGYRPPATLTFPSVINSGGALTNQMYTVDTLGNIKVGVQVTVSSAIPVIIRFHIV